MKFKALYIIVILLFSCSQERKKESVKSSITKIAFGSCGRLTDSLEVFNLVVKHKPDLFIFLGDNIYGDTEDMNLLKKKYQQLNKKRTYQNLKKNVDIISIWDDHDYGVNDVGRHYSKKEESKEIFLNFFNEPKDSDRWKHKGIYTSYMKEINGKKLQIILLDNRTFRDDLKTYNGEVKNDHRYFYHLDYAPHINKDSTFLGKKQWEWLKKELQKSADIRLIGSGTQFGVEYNGYESWANFPYEQQRFLNLIKETKANGVLFLSGDVHYAEISKLEVPNLYPIYDITSSGLSSTWHFATPNRNRIEGPIMENHFGLLTIDWSKTSPTIKAEIWDIKDNQRIEYSINLNQISF